MLKRTLLIFTVLFHFLQPGYAQDFPYKAATLQEVNMQRYDKDTSAQAVVLNEFGNSRITTKDGAIRLEHEYHVKIKIFGHSAFDKGTVAFKLRNNKDNSAGDEVEGVSGITTYIDDNNVLRSKELDPKLVYKSTDYKYQSTLKFAMPGLKDGCVIEYRYKIISPFFERIAPWEFQSDIPKVYSEFQAHIPAFWTYNAALRGRLKLTREQADVEYGCFSANGASSDCARLIYGMSDIPAFKSEDYMTSAKNFMASIIFNLVEYTNPYSDFKEKVTTTWRDVEHQLKIDEHFGLQLKKLDLLRQYIPASILSLPDTLTKAKAIYLFIQKSIKWNNYTGVYCDNALKKALDSHNGSIAEINLALVTALNAAGIKSEPVLLSTRQHGVVNKLYPVIDDFNYVAAKVSINGENYLLDATDPLLPFGMLQMECMNGEGRVFDADKPSYWVDLNARQKRKNVYLLNLTLQKDGKIKGTLNHVSRGYAAYEKRKSIKKYNDVNEYIDNLDARLNGVQIIKSTINNIDSLDLPVEEIYEVEIGKANGIDNDKLAFNPHLVARINVNPFKLSDRNYPVDIGMPVDDKYIVNLTLPDDRIIENLPQNIAVSLPGQGGDFVENFAVNDHTFTFSKSIQLNKTIYPVNDYQYLKDMFNRVILSEKSEEIIKKK